MGEGQRELPDGALDELNRLDVVAEAAVESGDENAFTAALGDLLAAVRRLGAALPVDTLVASDLVLPPGDATVEEVRHLFTGEADGLVPG